MSFPAQTFGTIQELIAYINTFIVPNAQGEIEGVEHNNVENGLANFIISYTLNSGFGNIVNSGGAVTLPAPVTIISQNVPTSIQWNNNVQNEFYVVNTTGTAIPLAGGFTYVDLAGAVQTSIPAHTAIHIAKATNGNWVQVNNVSGGIFPSVDPQTLLGRYANTPGPIQEITIGTGLNLDATTGVLSSLAVATARNGLSIDGDNFLVLGQDVGDGANPAILLNYREIPMDFFGVQFSMPGNANLTIDSQVALLRLFTNQVNRPVEFITQQGANPGDNPYGNFWITLDEAFINPDGQEDAVLQIGYNQNGGGGPALPGEAAMWIAFESHFQASGSAQMEFHLQSCAKDLSLNRHISITPNIFGGGAIGFSQLDSYFWQKCNDPLIYFGIDSAGNMNLTGPNVRVIWANTDPTYGQLQFNFDPGGGVSISNDTIASNNVIQIINAVQIINTNINEPSLYLPLINTPNATGIVVAGTVTGYCYASNVNVDASTGVLDLVQNVNVDGAVAQLLIAAQGTGVALTKWAVNNGGQFLGYEAGIDQVDSNKFKISYGAGGLGPDFVVFTSTSDGKIGIGGNTTPSAQLGFGPGTSVAGTAPAKLQPGVLLAVPEQGALEYDNTASNSLWFTRQAIQENIFIGLDGASHPNLSTGAAIVSFYGTSDTNFLGDPDSWAQVILAGTTYKIPLYL